ncbi:MAG: ion channel [Beijerinckiaceae bacterium]
MSTVFYAKREALYEKHGERLITVLACLLGFLVFIGTPLAALGGVAFHVIGGLTILGMIGVAIILDGRIYVLLPMIVAFAIASVAVAMRTIEPSVYDIYLSAFAWLVLSGLWAWIVARMVFGPGRVTFHRIVGAVFLYLLVSMVFACLYMIIGAGNPKAFSGLVVEDSADNASHLIYFSLATLTTAGFGDIVPVDPMARALSNLESVFGALYPATLIARLVSLEIEGRSKS